jgi:signal transduction histidine kinase
MSSQRKRDKPRRGRWLPGLRRRSVRLRLTGLYGALFFASGVALIAIVSGVTEVQSRSSVVASNSAQSATSALGQAQARIRQLQAQLAAQSSQTHSSVSHDLIVGSFIALATMTLISIVFGWLVAGRALRPVREMTAAAQRISEDSLNERLAVPGPADELKELGDTIDGLLERLESAFSAQRRFVANASHELRTPLATMRASLDVALNKPEPAPPQTVALAGRFRAELDRMDTLLEALLVLARAQHRDLPGHAVLPLDYVVSAALEGQAAAVSARNLTVQNSTGPSGAWVTGSKALLSRMVENVIDNAVRHNQQGGWIRIAADTDGGLARLTVENGGPLLDQRQVADLAQPFRRLGADRIGSDQGSGLGLSIVAAIVEAHRGGLDLRARENGGLRVRIELPAATSATTAAAVPAGSTA